MAEDPALSLNVAVKRVGPWAGVVPETLRGWAKHRQVYRQRPGTTTSDAARIRQRQGEVRG